MASNSTITNKNRVKSALKSRDGVETKLVPVLNREVLKNLKKEKEFREVLEQKKVYKKEILVVKKKLKKEEIARVDKGVKHRKVFSDLSKQVFSSEAELAAAKEKRVEEVLFAVTEILAAVRLENNSDDLDWEYDSLLVKFYDVTNVPLPGGKNKWVDEIIVRTFSIGGRLCYLSPRKNARKGKYWSAFPSTSIASIEPVSVVSKAERELREEIDRYKILVEIHPNIFPEVSNGSTSSLRMRLPKGDADKIMRDMQDAFDNLEDYSYEWEVQTSKRYGKYRRVRGVNRHSIQITPFIEEQEDGTEKKYVKARYYVVNDFKNSEKYCIISSKSIVRKS